MSDVWLELVFGVVPMLLVFSIPLLAIWTDFRRQIKALDVLKTYAEKGEEPPPEIIAALETPKPPPTRSDRWANSVFGLVVAVGATGVAWWLAPEDGDPGGAVIIAVVVALVSAAAAASNMVKARSMPNDGG